MITLQQLKYLIAIDRYRSFAKAAEACNISQPTLSSMLQKMEEELDLRIFERTNKRVVPTDIGERIIRQAERAISESEKIIELVAEEKGDTAGDLSLAVGPTIAPYIAPNLIKYYTEYYPEINLLIREMDMEHMMQELTLGHIDAAIGIAKNVQQNILEIPLYTENFMVYLAESCWRKLPVFKPENLEHEQMWIMKEAHCLRESAFSFCKARTKGYHIYEAGSIETLIRIVDENGGFTIIPEMHVPFLTDKQRENVRRIEGNYLSMRRISLYIKDDYIRQGMLNTVVHALLSFVPKKMMEERIVKFGIKI